MDIRRTILLMIFSLSLLTLWNNWQMHEGKAPLFGSTTPNTATVQSKSPQVASGVPSTPSTPVSGVTPASATPTPTETTAAPGQLVTVETDVLRLTFDLQGAQIVRAELLAYPATANTDEPIALLQRDNVRTYVVQSGLIGAADSVGFPTHLSGFKLLSDSLKLTGDTLEVKFQSQVNGVTLTKVFTLHRHSYAISVDHIVKNETGSELTPSLYLQITRDNSGPDQKPAGFSFFSGPSSFIGPAVYSQQDSYQKVNFSDIEKKKAKYISQTDNGWFAMIQHYFLTAWVPQEGKARNYKMVELSKGLFAMNSIESAGSIAAGQSVTLPATLWVGPQDQPALAAVAPGLDLVVDYGMLSIIAKPVFSLLTWIHKVLGNWGWSIIALTVLIKAAFYPLSAASYRSMAKMKQVSPRLQALKEKFGEDKQKLNTAMMEMYRTEKINPLGGCVPIVIQIPVFLSLYNVLLNSVELRGAPWIFWVNDLAAQDPYYILPAIMMGTMFLQMRLNPKPPDPVQAKVMMFMPLVFGGMMFFFPAGLVLYWCINNTLSIAQQWYITRKLNTAANDSKI